MTEAWIGIDQSYTGFGLCILRAREHTTVVQGFPVARHGSGIDRLHAVGRWLEDQLDQAAARYNIKHVCMEGYAYGSVHGREEAGELGAVVKTILRYRLDSPTCYPTLVPPPALKKYVSGSGRAAKDLILLAVKGIWGVDFAREMTKAQADNAADAYVLARIAMAMSGHGNDPRDLRITGILTAHTEMHRHARA